MSAKSRTILTWVFTAVAGFLAVAPAVLPERLAASYRPEVAVLAATLVAVIWYTRYTFETLMQSRAMAREERESIRRSLATALLAELRRLEGGLRQIHAFGGQGEVAWHRPVIETAFRQLALFAPETARQLADFSSLHEDVAFGLKVAQERGRVGDPAFERSLRTRAAFAIEAIPALVGSLQKEGGEMPPAGPDPAVHQIPDLPESPYGVFDPARGWQ